MTKHIISQLQSANHIVTVGSVDGVAVTAAVLRLIGKTDVGIDFTQAFQVGAIDVSKWAPVRKVVLLDLAVNLSDHEMTKAFIARIREAGHEIVAIIDEHDADHWSGVLGSFDGLAISPVSQATGPVKSASALLWLNLLGFEGLDMHLMELLYAGECGDRRDFTTHFGRFINEAVKSDIGNNARRVYLARHFAFSHEADETILGWVKEYETILENHTAILAAKQDLGDGAVRVVTGDQQVDMTSLMNGLYRQYKIVVVDGVMFDPTPTVKAKVALVSIATGDDTKDLVAAVKAAGIALHGGKGAKVNVDPADEAAALAAVRAYLNQ